MCIRICHVLTYVLKMALSHSVHAGTIRSAIGKILRQCLLSIIFTNKLSFSSCYVLDDRDCKLLANRTTELVPSVLCCGCKSSCE